MNRKQIISLLRLFRCGKRIDSLDMIVIESAINLLEVNNIDLDDFK